MYLYLLPNHAIKPNDFEYRIMNPEYSTYSFYLLIILNKYRKKYDFKYGFGYLYLFVYYEIFRLGLLNFTNLFFHYSGKIIDTFIKN